MLDRRWLGAGLALVLVAAACSGDDGSASDDLLRPMATALAPPTAATTTMRMMSHRYSPMSKPLIGTHRSWPEHWLRARRSILSMLETY